MKRSKHSLIIGLLLLGICGLQAQDMDFFKELFSKTESYYKNTREYALKVDYQFFEEGKPTQAIETLHGNIQKKGDNYYSKIDQTEFIYIGKTFLKINHLQKAVLYAPIAEDRMLTPIDISSLFAYFEKVNIHEEKGSFVCELTFKPIETIPYKKMILFLDRSTYAIKKQELYMLPGKSYPGQASREKTKAGKIVISLFPQKNKRDSSNLFNLSNYLLTNNGLSLSPKLSAYKLYNTNQ